MPLPDDLAAYIANHYGVCSAKPRCVCLANGAWIGVPCPFWHPALAKNWTELREIFQQRNRGKNIGSEPT